MKKWLKRNRWLIITIILVFVIPLLINISFQREAPLEFMKAEWKAGDELGFYGALVSAGIAVYGVFLSIQYAQRNYREDVRNRSVPFIVIDILKSKSYKTLFTESSTSCSEEKQEGYFKYKLQDYYCILEKGNINFKTGLTKEQQQILDNGGMQWIANASGGALVAIDSICVPIEIENVGNGSAIHFRYGLNRKNLDEHERKYLPVISLKKENPIMLHIFSEDCGKDSPNIGEYILAFYYQDIFENKYMQKFDVEIIYDIKKQSPIVSVNMTHKQEILEKRENGIY